MAGLLHRNHQMAAVVSGLSGSGPVPPPTPTNIKIIKLLSLAASLRAQQDRQTTVLAVITVPPARMGFFIFTEILIKYLSTSGKLSFVEALRAI